MALTIRADNAIDAAQMYDRVVHQSFQKMFSLESTEDDPVPGPEQTNVVIVHDNPHKDLQFEKTLQQKPHHNYNRPINKDLGRAGKHSYTY